MSARLDLEQVCYSYPGAEDPAVRDISISVEPGEILCLLGPSGCGKTTALKLIGGVLEPGSGDILLDGESILGIPPERRGAVMVFQSALLFPSMTVEQNVGFGLRVRRLPRDQIRARVSAMLASMKLSNLARRYPRELSGGQMQRAALARALVLEPRLLLLDEPLSALDAHLRQEMRELIARVQREFGVSTVFVTHDQQEAVELADRIALMIDGRVIQSGLPVDFYERPRNRDVAHFFGNRNELGGELRGDLVQTDLGEIQVDLDVVRASGLSDGPVCILLRPEHAVIRSAPSPNAVKAEVEHRLYMGTHTRYHLCVAGATWRVVVPAEDGQHEPGERVWLELPEKRVWLLPLDQSVSFSDQS